MDVILTGKEYTGIGLNFKMTIKFPLHLASFVAHLQCGRPGFDPWVWKIPWKRERLPTPSSILTWRIPRTTVHGVTKSWTQLSDFHFFSFLLYYCVGVLENFLPDIKNKTKQKTPQLWRNQQSLLGIFFSTGHLEFDAVISNAVMDAVFDLINFT